MGGEQSTPKYGFRVLHVQTNSPASQCGLVPYLDFILYRTAETGIDFKSMLRLNKGKRIELLIYNLITQGERRVILIPDDQWNGDGLIGARIMEEDYSLAHARVIRILNFYINSPLHRAGAIVNLDFIICNIYIYIYNVGTKEKSFEDIDEFSNYVRDLEGKRLQFIVYNSESEETREMEVIPDSQWGGNGILGGDCGFGVIHRIPPPKGRLKSLISSISTDLQVPIHNLSQSPAEEYKEEEKEETDPEIEKLEQLWGNEGGYKMEEESKNKEGSDEDDIDIQPRKVNEEAIRTGKLDVKEEDVIM